MDRQRDGREEGDGDGAAIRPATRTPIQRSGADECQARKRKATTGDDGSGKHRVPADRACGRRDRGSTRRARRAPRRRTGRPPSRRAGTRRRLYRRRARSPPCGGLPCPVARSAPRRALREPKLPAGATAAGRPPERVRHPAPAPPRSSATTRRRVATTMPRIPSAYGRASREATTTPALEASAIPATTPPTRPSSIVPRITISPARDRDRDRQRRPDRPFIGADGSSKAEHEQVPCLAGSSWTIAEITVLSGPSAAASDVASTFVSDRRPRPIVPSASDPRPTHRGASRHASAVSALGVATGAGETAMPSVTIRGYTRPRLLPPSQVASRWQ